MRKLAIQFYGLLACVGLSIQILTSVTWKNFSNVDFGYGWFMAGQAIGELLYFVALRRFFERYGFFVAVTEFAISLILVDLVTIIFLNPYEVSIPKYSGFLFALFILIVRAKKYIKPNG